MTVIAAYFRSATDYAIGADSNCQAGTVRTDTVEKLTRWGGVLFGGTGEWSLCQRAARFLTNREPPTGIGGLEPALLELHDHILTRVAPPQPNDGTANSHTELITVGPWGIVWLDAGGGLHRSPIYAAIGSGAVAARAAMWAPFSLAIPGAVPPYAPEEFVRLGVEAGLTFDTGCAGPVRVLRSEG